MLPPGPNIPSWLVTWNWLRRPYPFLDECARRYGPAFTLRIANLPTWVFFRDPEPVKEIFASDGDDLHAGELNATLAAFLGDSSVLMLDGKEHLRQRRLLLPPFHGERMQKYGGTMIQESLAAIDDWKEGAPFALHPFMQRITMRVILETIFGLRRGPTRDELEATLKHLLEQASWPPLLLPWMQKDLGPLSPWGKFLRTRDHANKRMFEEIAARRKEQGPPRDDVLSLLLAARDEEGKPMTDEELKDELTTLLVAGHETTATALAWAFRWILASPDVERKLRREIEGVDLVPEKIAKLEYLDAVIRESMRLSPVIPLVGRVVKRPMRLGGWELPPGVAAVCSIYLAQRRPEVFPRPWLFDPDRFLGKKFTPHEVFPFGGGIRRCIGMSFALYEMKMVLASVLSRCELTLAPKRPIVAERRSITLAPSEGLPVVMRRGARPTKASEISAPAP